MMDDSVIALTELEAGIFEIKMQDREQKNAFSDELTVGLLTVFEEVSARDDCKVVILTGYDSYFATGGTREGLMGLHEGKGQFNDTNLYSLAMDCPVPVISAMQGHGIGGGFVMGLFADVIIISRESVYSTNFMKYGFTPGMGATCIVPEKLGTCLGHEMLLLAKNYRGEDLKQRGVPFTVLPRDEVNSYALELARILNQKPRHSLITLKRRLISPIKAKLPEAVEHELAMHKDTFHREEVKTLIESSFGN